MEGGCVIQHGTRRTSWSYKLINYLQLETFLSENTPAVPLLNGLGVLQRQFSPAGG